MRPLGRLLTIIFATALALAYANSAAALILHPGDGAAFTPGPVVGRWGTSGSVVAIDSQYVITTRHQGGGVGTSVTINGGTYKVASITNIPDAATPGNVLDIRVARLVTPGGQNANLTDYVGIYESSNEVGKTLTIGGYGQGRGRDIIGGPGPNNGDVIGYTWDGTAGTLRWGANRITSSFADIGFGNYTNDVLVARFQGPDDSTAVTGEATLATGDSGGGWFIQQGGVWKLVALNQGVENAGEALFGEQMTGVRLSSYLIAIENAIPLTGDLNLDGDVDDLDIDYLFAQINAASPDLIADLTSDGQVDSLDADMLVEQILGTAYGDANLDALVDIADLQTLAGSFGGAGAWHTGDFDGDGSVTIADLQLMAGNFGFDATTPGSPSISLQAALQLADVPEPTSLGLLALMSLGLARRRGSAQRLPGLGLKRCRHAPCRDFFVLGPGLRHVDRQQLATLNGIRHSRRSLQRRPEGVTLRCCFGVRRILIPRLESG